MIEEIEVYLTYNNHSVCEIIELLDMNELLYLLSFIKGINKNIKSGCSGYVLSEENRREIEICSVLNRNDKDIIIKFFSGLGKSDTTGQISNCKMYKEILMSEYKKIQNEEKKQCKCVSTIILGCGFLIIILML